MACKTLAQLASSSGALDKAFHSVRKGSSSQSRGPNGITLAEFARNWPIEKKRLAHEIRNNLYCFGGYLGHAISKKGNRDTADLGAYRPISVANIRDRVVQRAVLNAIWKDIRDFVCTNSSFGGVRRYLVRSKRTSKATDDDKKCIKTAAKKIRKIYEEGNKWVFETDIKDFFRSIDRDRLMSKLCDSLRDNSLTEIIENSLYTSITNAGTMGIHATLWDSLWGVPQGGVLSPAMANFYLYDFDRAIEEAGFQMVRYVGDLVIRADCQEKAEAAYEMCCSVLSGMRLDIHPLSDDTKTRIVAV